MNITLTLSLEAVNGILQVFGQLPNSSNSYGLMMEIKKQAEEQVKAAEAEKA